jgi:RNA polymerase sigma factor (sigma-70 family)
MEEANGAPRLSPGGETAARSGTLDATQVAALYRDHGPELRRFVLGVVRDPDAAGDVLQATFTKAVELGHTARTESLKGWLFRVAYHEALTQRRRRTTRDQANRRLAPLQQHASERPEEGLIRGETAETVRHALSRLPAEQRRVVWARMYEDKTFAEIAAEDGLPLGTVLTRMRLALEKLRRHLREGD